MKSDDTNTKEGLQAGAEWARSTAEVDELKRLEALFESLEPRDEDAFWDADSNRAYSRAESIAFEARPEHEGERHAAEAFWEEALGDDHATRTSNTAFLQGFIRGALRVWREVKDQL